MNLNHGGGSWEGLVVKIPSNPDADREEKEGDDENAESFFHTAETGEADDCSNSVGKGREVFF